MQKKGKNDPKMGIWGHFPIFSAIFFPTFWERPKPIFCDGFARYVFVTFSWLFRGPHLLGKQKQCLGLFHGFFVAFSWRSFWAAFTRTRPGPAEKRIIAGVHNRFWGAAQWFGLPQMGV